MKEPFSSRFLLLAAGLAMLLAVLPLTLSAQQATVTATSLNEIRANGDSTGDSIHNVGSLLRIYWDRAGVAVFQLPPDFHPYHVELADFTTFYRRGLNVQSGEPALQLEAIRVSASDSAAYAGDYEAAATLIDAAYADDSTPGGAEISLSEAGKNNLAEWLENNANAGDYIFLRLKPDVDYALVNGGFSSSGHDRYEIRNATGYTFPTLTLEWEPPITLTSEQIAARFLHQATLGATYNEIVTLAAQIDQQGEAAALEAWIDAQLALPSTPLMDTIVAKMPEDWHDNGHSAAWTSAWLTDAVREPDQLRGRINYALHMLFVTGSKRGTRVKNGNVDYYDMLGENAFGNFRGLLYDVTMHEWMGKWLSHYRNLKANPAVGSNPDENYAREVMQLFSIGLFMLNQDGTRMVDGNGNDIPTYTNEQITEFAEVFTGLNSAGTPAAHRGKSNPTEPMMVHDDQHDTSSKVLLDYPGATNGGVMPPFVDDPNIEQEGLADINFAMDNLFYHPNTGPFIGRRLIQHLVTSNPTPAYISRVSAVFADNGFGVRGDMGAVIKAILLDPEARDAEMLDDLAHGRLDENWMRSVRMARNLDLISTDPNTDYFQVYGYATGSRNFIFGLEPMRQPSVFNWFQPDYQPFGELADAGLYGPEFQAYDDYNLTLTANGIKEITEFGWPGNGNNTSIDLTNLLALLSNEGESGLVNWMDLVFCRGLMSPETRTIIEDAIISLSDPTKKVQLAIYLTTTSVESAVLR